MTTKICFLMLGITLPVFAVQKHEVRYLMPLDVLVDLDEPDPETVESLIKQLSGGKYQDREAATKSLIQMGGGLLKSKVFRKALSSPDLHIRRLAEFVYDNLSGPYSPLTQKEFLACFAELLRASPQTQRALSFLEKVRARNVDQAKVEELGKHLDDRIESAVKLNQNANTLAAAQKKDLEQLQNIFLGSSKELADKGFELTSGFSFSRMGEPPVPVPVANAAKIHSKTDPTLNYEIDIDSTVRVRPDGVREKSWLYGFLSIYQDQFTGELSETMRPECIRDKKIPLEKLLPRGLKAGVFKKAGFGAALAWKPGDSAYQMTLLKRTKAKSYEVKYGPFVRVLAEELFTKGQPILNDIEVADPDRDTASLPFPK